MQGQRKLLNSGLWGGGGEERDEEGRTTAYTSCLEISQKHWGQQAAGLDGFGGQSSRNHWCGRTQAFSLYSFWALCFGLVYSVVSHIPCMCWDSVSTKSTERIPKNKGSLFLIRESPPDLAEDPNKLGKCWEGHRVVFGKASSFRSWLYFFIKRVGWL